MRAARRIAVDAKIAGKLLGLSPKTLANWRVKGIGPSFVKGPGKRGAVRYQLGAIAAWQKSHLRNSTSDDGAQNV